MATGRIPDPNTAPVTAKGDLYTYSTVPAKLTVGSDGETLVADSSASVGLRYQEPKAGNPVINSAFQVWQRGTSISVAASTTAGFTADRWSVNTGANGASTVSRQTTSDSTNLPNIQYCARVQRNSGQTGTSVFSIYNSFESVNSIPFAGKTVTVSFYARKGANYSAASDVLKMQVLTGTGTDQNVSSGYTGLAVPISYNATLTTTWQRFTATGTLSASLTELAVGFEFTPVGTAGAADYYEVTGVQLEVGSVATPFKTQGVTLAGELAACQRYYVRIAGDGGYAYDTLGIQGNASSTGACQFPILLPVTMRSAAASVDSLGVGITLAGTATYASTGVTLAESNPSAVLIAVTTATTLTQYRPYFLTLNNNANGYIGFSAEL